MRSLLEVWSQLATIDLVVRGATTEAHRARLRDHFGAASVEGLPEADEPARTGRLGWVLHRHLPFEVAQLDPEPARRRMRHLGRRRERPDVVFAADPFLAWLLRPALPPVPWLVDLPDVRGPSPWGEPLTAPAVRRLLRAGSIIDLLAVDRAARFELAQAGIAHVATVRSEGDREALGSPTAVVLPDERIDRDYRDLARATVEAAGTYASKAWS